MYVGLCSGVTARCFSKHRNTASFGNERRDMPAPSPPRVALCLAGQFRDHFNPSAEHSVHSRLKALTAHPPAGWEVDVFVDTWIESGLGRKHENNVLVSSPLSEASALDPNWLTSYPRLAGLRVERTPARASTLLRGVTIPRLLRELAPEHYSGTLPHLWKMYSCKEQWQAWEIDQQVSYDAVIKMRPDSQFFTSSMLSHIMGAVGAILGERHLPDHERTHLFTSSEHVAATGMVSDKYAVGTPRGMGFYMDLWQTAPALWKEWEGRSNASRGVVPVGERLMFRHMQKAAFRHVSGFPGESSPRELRQKRLNKLPAQIALQASASSPDTGGDALAQLEQRGDALARLAQRAAELASELDQDPAAATPEQPRRLELASDDGHRRDPRLSEACRRFHGAWASPPAANVIVRTVEDAVANRSAPSGRRLRQPFGTCDMPYGRLAQGGNFYVEVPKTGSTTMKARFKDGADATDDLPPGFPRSDTKSFVFVREPLERMLSGYGTLVKRLKSRLLRRQWPDFLFETNEAARFNGFVDMLTSHTDEALASKGNNIDCVWQHVMSQMWFLNNYPAEITFVARMEQLEAELSAISLHLNVSFGAKGNSNVNEGELEGVDIQHLSRTVPHAVAKLLAHLSQDYECLQYPVPSIRALARD